MANWYDMPGALSGFEDTEEFIEKCAIDDGETESLPAKSHAAGKRDNSWVRNRSYKKKMVREFLSLNPDMNYAGNTGMKCSYAIYLDYPHVFNGEFQDARIEYLLNPYTKVYLSERGDLRRCCKYVSYYRGSFAISNNKLGQSRITNRRIRKKCVDEDTSYRYSYAKKLLGPMIDDGW